MPNNSLEPKQAPVILVHGFWNTHRYLHCLAKRLRKKGWQVHSDFDLVPNNGGVGIEVLAQQLADYVQQKIGEGKPFHLVGYSMGGLVARYYVQYMAQKELVQSLVTIATPHHGTYRAYTFNRIGLIQMRPDSRFLSKLNADIHLLKDIHLTSIWTRFDTIVIPNKSARLPLGKEVVLPIGVHAFLPFEKRVLEHIEAALL